MVNTNELGFGKLVNSRNWGITGIKGLETYLTKLGKTSHEQY